MCNAIKIMHSGYVLTLTDLGRENLVHILDSFVVLAQADERVWTKEIRYAAKIMAALIEPVGVQKVEVGK